MHDEPQMRRVIRDKMTGRFFSHGEWTRDFKDSEHFGDTLSIVRAHHEHGLRNVEVVLVFGERPSSMDIVLPLIDLGRGQLVCSQG